MTDTETSKKIATCKACGYTWNVDNDGGHRKRKCPKCRKYQIEYSDIADINPKTDFKRGADKMIAEILNPPQEPEPETEEPEKKSGKIHNPVTGAYYDVSECTSKRDESIISSELIELPDGSGVAFGTVGEDEDEDDTLKTPEQEPKKIGGIPLIAVIAVFVVLAITAGWCFLSFRNARRHKAGSDEEDNEV